MKIFKMNTSFPNLSEGNKMKSKIIAALFLFISSMVFPQSKFIHHNLNVKVSPDKSYIEVTDEITIPENLVADSIAFSLNSSFKPLLRTPEFRLILTKKNISAHDIGMDREEVESYGLALNKYQLVFLPSHKGDIIFKIQYKGKINSPLEQSAENYARGFSQSPGIISHKGVYLAGSTYWVPNFDDKLVTFNLTVELPKGWKSVSQGKRVKDATKDGFHIDKWDSPTPQEEVFLIAAKFTEYKYDAGSVTVMAFLRKPDDGLANKYLETTAQYLEMDRQLIGPFPYPKFALVENFWETGYGMPSFTLLGEKIIRFPFILHSSYPHELLHNYWGNGVYVDFSKGNWCEGLTAYMADHLIKEQRGQGVDYRRSTVQKFTDYVNEKNDFPLKKFRSRFDAASEAIGYGKSLMMWHMLRKKVGDENFIKSLQNFYRNNKFKRVSFDDIRKSFEDVTGENLKQFFDQWVNRTGAPVLSLGNVEIKRVHDFFDVTVTLEQTQKEKPFTVDVPVGVATKNGSKTKVFTLTGRKEKFSINVKDKPLEVLVDPQYDVFRKLDPNEIPPALSTAYGKEKALIVLPGKASPEKLKLYNNFTAQWKQTHKRKDFTIVKDSEVKELPADRTIYILGFDNTYLKTIRSGIKNYKSSVAADSVKFGDKVLTKAGNDFIISVRNPKNIREVMLLLTIGNNKAIPGLVRKLPHYGKYGYLAFEGDEPTNIAKGQWPIINSPLVRILDNKVKNIHPKLEERKALAYLKPVFSGKRMLETIKFLASDELKGRGLGTKELDKAADYIAEHFKAAGLLPAGDNATYFQTWHKIFKSKGRLKLRNVIGIIPGTSDKLKDTYVVISAHYDHLGFGWPDVHKGDKGKIHHGADDNASGISVLLELAKTMGKSAKPARTIVFAAFSGEEEGLVGSKYFVKNFPITPDNTIADLNLDTVGRLEGKKLLILNGNSAYEWKFVFMGTEYTTGIKTDMVTQQLDASDQVSFIKNGIPAVQFFSGPNIDYHRPTDTVDKIDPDGLVKVATVAKEVLEYLSEREEPLKYTGPKKLSNAEKSIKTKEVKKIRRVSTGTIPDFAFSGVGVKVSGVAPNSPGEKAGLQKGDVIRKFNGKDVRNLRDYSNYLKEHQPGDKVTMTVERNGKTKKIELILAER